MESNEIVKLKADNAQLKAENNWLESQVATPSHKRTGFIKKLSAVVLVIIAVLALTVGNLFFWSGNTIVKPDRFTDATAPIIKDSEVQKALSLYTTNSIFNNVDVTKTIENALPPKADFLALQFANQLKSATQNRLQETLSKPRLQDNFNTVLARQHKRLINFASSYTGNGDISLNDVFTNLTATLAGTKLGFLANKQLPPKVGDITLINVAWLPAFHKLVANIDTWRFLAILLLVVSLTAAVWLSQNRRRTIYLFSFTSVLMMLITLFVLNVASNSIVGKVDPQYSLGVEHVINIFTHPLIIQTLTIVAGLGVVAVVAWVSSSAYSASLVKQRLRLTLNMQLHRYIFHQDNSYTMWVQHNKQLLEWSVVALVAVGMLLFRLTPLGLVIYVSLLLLLVMVIEIVGGQKSKGSLTL
jgi:hypothetical protein